MGVFNRKLSVTLDDWIWPGVCVLLRSSLGGDVGTRGACSGSEADFGNGGGVVLRVDLLIVRCAVRSVPLSFAVGSVEGRCSVVDGDVKGNPKPLYETICYTIFAWIYTPS